MAAAAAALSFSPFHLDQAASTRMLKDFLQESNGNGDRKTASFVKRISFPSLKLRKIFPRSLSRRLSGMRERDERETGGDFVVKVKDIIRWRSFRDLVDETAEMAAPPLDFADSPGRYTAAATTTTTTTATNSNSSSWCESDFTAEDLPSPSWKGCSDDDEAGKVYFSCVGEDSSETPATKSENDKKVNLLSRNDNKDEQSVKEERSRRLLEHTEETIPLSRSYKLLELFQRERPYYQESETNNSTGEAKEVGNELFRSEFSYQQASENEEERDNNNGKLSMTEAEEDENELFRREFSCYQESEDDEERDKSDEKLSSGEAKEVGNELFRSEFSYQQASENEEERDNNNGKLSMTEAEEDENELFRREFSCYQESEDDEERDKSDEKLSSGKAKEDGNELFRSEFSYQQASENEEERDNNNGKLSMTEAEEDENELFRREFSCYQESEDDEERDKSDEKLSSEKAKEDGNDFGWILSQKGKENLCREMEREGKWGVFGNEEREELGLQIEGGIFGCLVDEIMLHIFKLSL